MRKPSPFLIAIAFVGSIGINVSHADGPRANAFTLNELLVRDVETTLNDPRVQVVRDAITVCIETEYQDKNCGAFIDSKIPIEDIRGKFIVIGSGFNVTQPMSGFGIIFIEKPVALYSARLRRGKESYKLVEFRETPKSLKPGRDNNGFRNILERVYNILKRDDLSI